MIFWLKLNQVHHSTNMSNVDIVIAQAWSTKKSIYSIIVHPTRRFAASRVAQERWIRVAQHFSSISIVLEIWCKTQTGNSTFQLTYLTHTRAAAQGRSNHLTRDFFYHYGRGFREICQLLLFMFIHSKQTKKNSFLAFSYTIIAKRYNVIFELSFWEFFTP